MTDEQLDRAQRMIADPRWKWLPGMRDSKGRRVIACFGIVDVPLIWVEVKDGHEQLISMWGLFSHARDAWEYAVPDLTDPATVGAVLAVFSGHSEVRSLLDEVCKDVTTKRKVLPGDQ